MLGNVGEWVADCHRGDYEATPTDGSVTQAGPCEARVVRGGSWIDGASTVRAAYRHALAPTRKKHQFGLGVARAMGH